MKLFSRNHNRHPSRPFAFKLSFLLLASFVLPLRLRAQCPDDITCNARFGSVLAYFQGDTARLYSGDEGNFFGTRFGLGLELKAFGNIVFYASPDPFLTERMRITDSGFVGINTASPQAPLHVGGGAIFAGFTRVDSVFQSNSLQVVSSAFIAGPLSECQEIILTVLTD